MIEKTIAKITSLQPNIQNAAWLVGEQLKDMCKFSEHDAALILHDLDIPEMSLVHAEKKIKEYADSHKTGNFACVTPIVAEDILREFYGLSARGEQQQPPIIITTPQEKKPSINVSLTDFL